MSSRSSVCLAAWLVASCGEKIEPPVATPDASEPVVVTPDTPEPAAPVVEVARPDTTDLIGWWRSDSVCLELFSSGDFELSMQSSDPKLMVLGRATLTPSAGDLELKLAVSRIWRARFTGPCRKVHEFGRWSDGERLLGVEFKPDSSVTLKLRRVGGAQVELCGATCETLTRATPMLSGRWRRAGMAYPDRASPAWAAGDLLEIELDDEHGHVWAGLADGEFATVNGPLVAEFVADHRFKLRFGVRYPAEVTPTALGLKLGPRAKVELDARRLADERLEVCSAPGRCATLERQFSGDHHDLR